MRWAAAEDFMQLAVMPRMILDHLPENVDKVLDTILQKQQELEHQLHWYEILFQLAFVWHSWNYPYYILCVRPQSIPGAVLLRCSVLYVRWRH